ncbi:cytochrome P450 [cf. Phormidesmis sp. LEGE 11477]|uniref:cytochrome P450 n=1 Tax=cf. Phormidesmis sp. LEGE 11477 TaxID=1828680 RepID=UPI00188166DF|nr:cytochrome P450 [cf. Phormidesmis sp. LEGE 11477]MBE9059753.1 cytochrome P450 [cf. Phormidesmis sp. LEGE 11477]
MTITQPDTAANSTISWTVPGPSQTPIVGKTGNAFQFIQDPIGHSNKLFQKYGPIASLARGGKTNLFTPFGECPGTVVVYGPELIRKARTPHSLWNLTPFSMTLYPMAEVEARKEPLKHFLVGLWGVNGTDHQRQRRLMMPAFHGQKIQGYWQDMVEITESSLNKLQPGETINLIEMTRLLAMRIATKTLFGEDSGEEGQGVGHLIEQALEVLSKPITALLPHDVPGLPYRKFLNLITDFDEAMRAVIAQKRSQPVGDSNDVLSMLIQARDEETGDGLSEDELLGHVGSIFAAGHETTSLALGWTMLLLSQHPQIAADLLDELTAVLQGEAPRIDQLDQLPLLDGVIKESLRLIPSVPFTWRYNNQPIELGGHLLPVGTEVYCSIYATHHMPELYPQPQKFDPSRWEHIQPDTWEYMPFHAGSRMCIGAAFAKMELKVVLAMLLQRYRLELVPTVPIDRYGLITIAPKNGLPMRIHAQDRNFNSGVGGVRGNVREMVDLPK